MKLSLPLAIIIAAIAWIVLYVILSVPLWIAFVVAAAIIVVAVAGTGGHRTAAS
jgi:hypothetical protein